MIDRNIPRYRILEKLGSGGMGVVFRAEDVRLRRFVALKFLPEDLARDAQALTRFEREAQAASALNHPHICTIYDVGEQDGRHFIAMELLEGEALNYHIAVKPLALDIALRLGIEIADALDAAHRANIIHRDIKPGNIFMMSRGQSKILDFGLAKVTSKVSDLSAITTITEPDRLTRIGAAVGTLMYMSPEQARGEELDARTDLFSFGAVLYEVATGQKAFPGSTAAVIYDRILNRQPLPPSSVNPTLPARFDEIVSKAMEKDRGLRYQSASDIHADLQRLKRDIESERATMSSASQLGTQAPEQRPIETAAHAHSRWKAAAGAIIVIAVVAAAGLWLFHTRTAHALSEKDTIMLADFSNRTGDPVFSDALRQGLSVQLEQSPFLNIVPDQQVEQTLTLMGQKADARLEGDVAREVCQRTASAAEIEGSITQIGAQYSLILKAVACSNGASLASTESDASDKDHVLGALGKAATNLRDKLGESLSTVQKYDTPLEQASTPSLEALQALSQGFKVLYGDGGSPEAIPFFKHAVELDHNFAMAYAILARTLIDVQEFGPATDAMQKAYQLRDHASEREKFFIDSNYYTLVSGDLQKAEDTCQLWIQAYPRAVEARNVIAGPVDLQLGNYDQTIENANAAVRDHPDLPVAYAHLMIADIALNRREDAKAAYQQATEHKVDSPFFFDPNLYLIAFIEGDRNAMSQIVNRNAGKSGLEEIFLADESLTAAYSGELAKSREFSRQAAAAARREDNIEAEAGFAASDALTDALFGFGPEARQRAAATLKTSKGRDNEYAAALAFGFSGDATAAQTAIDDLARRFPEDSIVQFHYLPVLRAQMALNRKDPKAAIETLKIAASYELGQPGTSFFIFFDGFPIYVRAEAYLAAGDGADAATEFQKVLDHPGIVMNEPIGALAHLGMARALALQGDKVKARSAYADFFGQWKNADSDIPILKQAQSEYARLN